MACPSGWGWVGGRWTQDLTGGGLLTPGAGSELRQGQWAGQALRSKHTQTFWMVPATSCQGLLTGGPQPALGLARLHCLGLKAGVCRPPESPVPCAEVGLRGLRGGSRDTGWGILPEVAIQGPALLSWGLRQTYGDSKGTHDPPQVLARLRSCWGQLPCVLITPSILLTPFCGFPGAPPFRW